MTDLKEQRICCKFCFNLKKIDSETYRTLIKAFYDGVMSRLPMLSGFQVNQTSARDFECSVPPSLSQIGENVENVC